MFAPERRQLILELVQANGAVSLRDLATAVGSSEVTIRRDVRALEDNGLIDRRHGGAVRTGGLSHEASYSQKRVVAAAEKAAIAALAATMVSEGDAIVVGSGTTTLELSRRLTRMVDLTVVTTSILVAQSLAAAPAEVVLTGGILRGATFALVGSAAEQSLAGLRVARAFISGNGLSVDRGLSTPNMMVASVDRAIAAAAQQVVLLVDHTKLGIDTMFQTVPPGSITHLVTDDRADPRIVEQFTTMGVDVRTASVSAALDSV
jgi:DeoR/GlpR family transcriptional regulator of sugar metabolism